MDTCFMLDVGVACVFLKMKESSKNPSQKRAGWANILYTRYIYLSLSLRVVLVLIC